jgi:hypothetical protein
MVENLKEQKLKDGTLGTIWYMKFVRQVNDLEDFFIIYS